MRGNTDIGATSKLYLNHISVFKSFLHLKVSGRNFCDLPNLKMVFVENIPEPTKKPRAIWVKPRPRRSYLNGHSFEPKQRPQSAICSRSPGAGSKNHAKMKKIIYTCMNIFYILSLARKGEKPHIAHNGSDGKNCTST